jgi:UDP-N-acetylglucosamine 1-carboxyvinyltransferase
LFIKPKQRLNPINITTLCYPGFPTDLQAQFMAALSFAKGISLITEKIYPDRFMHVGELNRMGAAIQRSGPHCIIEGKEKLFGAEIMASDLRASAALVIAGLAAQGKTEILRVYHIDRGYEKIENKLKKLGAKIVRKKQ